MERVLRQILSDLHNNKLSHAVLIDGGTPDAREKTAWQAAQAILCGGQTKPCGVCASCVKASSHAHPDILVYSGGATPGSFKVDMVREIRAAASVLPNESEYKVFILLACESMLPAAQNALLKILEEPPYFVRFILCCNSHSAMLDTILSRATVYSAADSTQDDEKTQDAERLAREILQTVSLRNEAELLRITSVFEKDKALFRASCMALARLAADILVRAACADACDAFTDEIVSRVPSRQLMLVVDIANQTVQSMLGNSNANLLLAVFCAQLCADANERI